MGLIGKTGIVVAGGIPVAFAGIEALTPWTNAAWANAQIATKLKGSAAFFTNTLTQGFGLGAAIPGTAVQQGDSSFLVGGATEGTPYAGSWFKTTGAGISLVVIDGVIGVITRFAAGGRVRPKVMGRQLISG